MPIDREFLAGQHSGAINALFNAHRQLGRIEGARDVYLALHKLVEDEEQADAIEAANAAHHFADTRPTTFEPRDDLDGGLADAVRANLSATEPAEAPDRGKPIVVHELDHPHEGDPGDENDHHGSNDDPAAALAPKPQTTQPMMLDLPYATLDEAMKATAIERDERMQAFRAADGYRDR